MLTWVRALPVSTSLVCSISTICRPAAPSPPPPVSLPVPRRLSRITGLVIKTAHSWRFAGRSTPSQPALFSVSVLRRLFFTTGRRSSFFGRWSIEFKRNNFIFAAAASFFGAAFAKSPADFATSPAAFPHHRSRNQDRAFMTVCESVHPHIA